MQKKILTLAGYDARQYIHQIASLRLTVFNEYPYLYEGTRDYEANYLQTYFKANNSCVILIEVDNQIVGASTGVWAQEADLIIRQSILDYNLDPKKVFYFGESVLLSEFRGLGFGKIFMQQRETFAKTIKGVEWLAFCGVIRDAYHPLKPKGYKPLDNFWQSWGFHKEEGLTAQYSWKDIGQNKETAKTMQFWLKKLTVI